MNTLKKQILTKKFGDKIPSEFEVSDSDTVEDDAQEGANQTTINKN